MKNYQILFDVFSPKKEVVENFVLDYISVNSLTLLLYLLLLITPD